MSRFGKNGEVEKNEIKKVDVVGIEVMGCFRPASARGIT
jgi:hypothetical protein